MQPGHGDPIHHEVQRRLPFRVHVVQTDNGAEFQSQFYWHQRAWTSATCTSAHGRRISTARRNGPIGSTTGSSTSCSTRTASRTTFTCSQQQARFDDFITCYNQEQALGMKVPPDLYTHSPRVYPGLEELTHSFHDATHTVTRCGRISFKGRKVNLSQVFAGRNVGVTQVGERIWWSPSCATIWATSTMKPVGWNRSKTRLARKCYPSARAGINCYLSAQNRPIEGNRGDWIRTSDLPVPNRVTIR